MGPVELVRLHSNLMAGAPGLQVEATSTPDRVLGRAAAAFPCPKRRGGSVDRGMI